MNVASPPIFIVYNDGGTGAGRTKKYIATEVMILSNKNKRTWVFNGKHYHDAVVAELEKDGWNFNPTREEFAQFILTNEDYEQIAKETETLVAQAAQESKRPLE